MSHHTLSKLESESMLLSPCTKFGFRTNGFFCWKSDTKLSISLRASTCPASQLKHKNHQVNDCSSAAQLPNRKVLLLLEKLTGWTHQNHEQGGKTNRCQWDQIQDEQGHCSPAIKMELASQIYQKTQTLLLSA